MQNNIISTLFVGQNLLTLKEVDSTNNYLKNILTNSKPVPEGTVIMAESQYAGRGQQQNRWHSQPGKNLTFSLLLKPSFLNINDQFDLNRIISIGVFEALYPLLGDALKIKWPNDIYYDSQKLGGILIENTVKGASISNSIVGIGLNINQGEFPPDAINATSLRKILHRDYELKTLLSDICAHIEANYLNLKAGKIEHVRNAYLNRLYRLNEWRYFKVNDEVFEGVITGVRDNGLLVVKRQGHEMVYNLKEIEFLNKVS